MDTATLAETYRATRASTIALLADMPAARCALPVPACPGWSVRDLTAHLLQVCREGRGGEPATGPLPYEPTLDVPALFELWEADAPALEARIPRLDPISASMLVLDAFAHEQDLRYALGLPQPDRHPAFPASFRLLQMGFGRSLAARGLPPVRFEAAEDEPGPATGTVTVRAPRHAIFRALAGRRSARQIAAMDWSEPAERYLPAFSWGPFRVPRHDVEQ